MNIIKQKSPHKKVVAAIREVSEKLIFLKNKTADFIGHNICRAKAIAVDVKDKTAVFFDDVTYAVKGHAFNMYDKIRFRSSKYLEKGDVDIISYRGEPKPQTTAEVKSFAVSKMTDIRSRFPETLPAAGKNISRSFRKFKYRLKKACFAARDNMAVGFENTKEYAMNLRKSTVIGASSVVVGGLVLALMLTTIANSYAMGVTINGEKVGFVENKDDLAVMVEDVERELSAENNNANVQIKEDAIEVDTLDEPKSEVAMMDENKLKEKVVNANAVTATASAITVDGKPVLYVGNQSEAKAVLQAIKQKYYVSGEDVITGFRQNVSMVDASVNAGDVMPTQNAITFLLTGNETIQKYKVKEDDTDWDIARANGLSSKELQKLNPQLDTEVIKEGDVLNISKMQPFVQMEVIATVNVKEKTNYKTKKVETDDMYIGESKVKREGKRGETSVTKRSVFVNGKEESYQLIYKDVIKKPKDRVVLVGTKEKPSESSYDSGSSYSGGSDYSGGSSGGGSSYVSGNGTLSNPVRNMELSSPFGYRWGRLHAGIDLRNPSGTPIYAAASGTVTSAGYDGAYGYCVRISHGNGMTTLYGHCSRLYVSSGEKVSRGENIAAVGSTGRSTGNHLHFEVRINGTPKNPYNYL